MANRYSLPMRKTREEIHELVQHEQKLKTRLQLATTRLEEAERERIWAIVGDCSKYTGFIQPVHDGVRRGFVDGLRLGLHATYPGQDAPGSALACAPGRPAFASCGSVGCPAPPHSTWTAAVCRRETSALSPGSGKRAS